MLSGHDGAVLFGRGQVAMQRQYQQISPPRDRLALAHSAPDLRGPRQKSQHIAGGFLGDQQLKRIRQLCLKALRGVGQMPDRNLEQSPL